MGIVTLTGGRGSVSIVAAHINSRHVYSSGWLGIGLLVAVVLSFTLYVLMNVIEWIRCIYIYMFV